MKSRHYDCIIGAMLGPVRPRSKTSSLWRCTFAQVLMTRYSSSAVRTSGTAQTSNTVLLRAASSVGKMATAFRQGPSRLYAIEQQVKTAQSRCTAPIEW